MNDDQVCSKLLRTYQRLLKKRIFIVTATEVNLAKLKYLKKSLAFSQMAYAEMTYYQEHIQKIVNIFMDVLIAFISQNEPENINPLNYIIDRWQSIYNYWINSNRQSALDDDWVVSTINQPSGKQPQNMRLVYKMFVLCKVIRTEVCHLPKENLSNLPQFNTIFARLRKI